MDKKNNGFIIVSTLIILSDVIFILLNYYSSLNAFNNDIGEWAIRTEKFFRIASEDKATSMQQLATFIANDRRVATLFKQGKEAVTEEGGGSGKGNSALVRQRLYNLLYPSWVEMTKKYDVRQLHFHLGPGSTSFLRIHRPEKFGDNMDDVRFTVVDVNQTHEPTKGFETGRVYSGIRGVSPVFYENAAGPKEYIGALEAGTSFVELLKSLHENLDSEFSVLLSKEHVHRNMWKDFVSEHFDPTLRIGEYFIEAATGTELKTLAEDEEFLGNLKSKKYAFINKFKPFQVCIFPLRDYRGTKDSTLPDSGIILVIKDATEKWEMLKNGVRNNIIYSLIALMFVEIILYFVWKYSRNKLTKIIENQTAEINSQYERLKSLIESFPIGVLIVESKSGLIIEANLKFSEMIGMPIKSVEGSLKDEFIIISDKKEEDFQEIFLLNCSENEKKYVLSREIELEIQGKQISIVSLADITHQKQIEMERIKKEKLEGVLEMAGAVCHEINQPLMVLSGYAELIQGNASNDDETNKYATHIKKQVDRLGSITKKLMSITDYQTKEYLEGKIIDIDKSSTSNE